MNLEHPDLRLFDLLKLQANSAVGFSISFKDEDMKILDLSFAAMAFLTIAPTQLLASDVSGDFFNDAQVDDTGSMCEIGLSASPTVRNGVIDFHDSTLIAISPQLTDQAVESLAGQRPLHFLTLLFLVGFDGEAGPTQVDFLAASVSSGFSPEHAAEVLDLIQMLHGTESDEHEKPAHLQRDAASAAVWELVRSLTAESKEPVVTSCVTYRQSKPDAGTLLITHGNRNCIALSEASEPGTVPENTTIIELEAIDGESATFTGLGTDFQWTGPDRVPLYQVADVRFHPNQTSSVAQTE